MISGCVVDEKPAKETEKDLTDENQERVVLSKPIKERQSRRKQ